jgi:CxxC motif-containing protein (DUF1111 family)
MLKAVSLLLLAAIAHAGEVPPMVASEEFPGGTGTTSDHSTEAFSHPMAGTRGADRREFAVGNSFFNLAWVSSPSTTTARDGLGPTFNATACSACHFKDGRGRGLPEVEGATDVSLLFRLRMKMPTGEVIPHPSYGGQLQPNSIQGVPAEGDANVRYERINVVYDDGIVAEIIKPLYEFVRLNFGALGEDTIASPRVAPQMIGLGLIEAIQEADILKKEDPYDADGDGISGRANRVSSVVHGDIRLGRFGWKAGKASLIEQNAAAFVGDMGITSPLFPEEDCPPPQIQCAQHRTVEDIDQRRLEQVTTYTQLLAVPVRRDMRDPAIITGRALFHKANCIACHTPSYVTGSEAEFDVLKEQTIYPYSDFLLHDMGEGLADSTEDVLNEADASTREWRTPPLWGIGLIKTVNGHTRLLHDGRARNVAEAILWHGGEGANARDAFKQLSRQERADLIKFVESL